MTDKEKMLALINEIKATAIKEFAERLKKCSCLVNDGEETVLQLNVYAIDMLMDEMLGGDK